MTQQQLLKFWCNKLPREALKEEPMVEIPSGPTYHKFNYRLSFRGIFSRNQLRKSFIGLLKKLLNLNVGLVCGVKMQLYIPLKSHVPLCQSSYPRSSYPRIVSDVLLSALPTLLSTSAELQQLSFTDSISMLAVLLLLFLRSCYNHQPWIWKYSYSRPQLKRA